MYIDVNEVKIGDVTIFKSQLLGEGNFGYVFKGTFKEKPCAVKVILELGRVLTIDIHKEHGVRKVQEKRIDCLEKERKYLLECRHPNIVELFHFCSYPDRNLPCLVMELLDCSLRKYLAETCEHLPRQIQISLSYNIGNALVYLHEKQIIHRDLCGDNILIQKSNPIPIAKIADFGMSRIIDPQKMTHSLSILANREGYLPPEGQTKEYDLSLDIHMFGVIMVQIVEAVTDISSAKVRHKLINKIEESHPLKEIINSCTMVDKEARPTAINISRDLQDLL